MEEVPNPFSISKFVEFSSIIDEKENANFIIILLKNEIDFLP